MQAFDYAVLNDNHIERTVSLCTYVLAHNALMPGMSSIVKRENLVTKNNEKDKEIVKEKAKEKEKDSVIGDKDQEKRSGRGSEEDEEYVESSSR